MDIRKVHLTINAGRTRLAIPLRSMMVCGMAGTLIACSASMHPEIEQADRQLTVLKQELPAEALAGPEVQKAEEAVARAKADWKEDHDNKEAMHLSYVAGQRIEIARLATRAEQARQEAETLNQQRDIVKLESQKNEMHSKLSIAEQRNLLHEQALANIRTELQELKAEQTARGLELTLGDVLFQTDKAELKPGAVRRLVPLAKQLVNNPELQVRIEGHTDSEGSNSYNADLSRRRAESVKAALVSLDTDADRIEAVGLGEEYPLTSNDTQAGRQENRRVDIVISGPKSQTVTTSRREVYNRSVSKRVQ